MTYRVTIQPAGHQFPAETNETLLDAGLRNGIMLPYGCRGGVCGSCVAIVTSGEVVYPNGVPQGLFTHEQAQGKTFLCMAAAGSDVVLHMPRVGVEPDIMSKAMPVRVECLRLLADDVMEMTLKLPASEHLRFRAGQYLDILLKNGKRRAFSIASKPSQDQLLELHIRHVPNGEFTGQVFSSMKAKSLLRIEAPLGDFYLRDSERPLILMGGGTGFAPLKSMVEHLLESSLVRPVYLYWGARAKDDLYLDALAREWAAQQPLLHYVPVLSAAQPQDAWQGRTGWVHAAVAADFPDLSGYDVYLCGPPPMIIAARQAFLAQGLPEEQLYADAFEYGVDTLQAMQADGAA